MQFMEREFSVVGFMITTRKIQGYLCAPDLLKLSSVVFGTRNRKSAALSIQHLFGL